MLFQNCLLFPPALGLQLLDLIVYLRSLTLVPVLDAIEVSLSLRHVFCQQQHLLALCSDRPFLGLLSADLTLNRAEVGLAVP